MNRINTGSENGKRFDNDGLNLKKVFATILAIVIIILAIVSIVNLLKEDKKTTTMQVPTAYFTCKTGGRYGVIDSNGNTIIKPTYEEMIIIPNKSKPVFVVTYDVDYATGSYKTKVINDKGTEILKDYSNCFAIENSYGADIWYEDNVLRFERDGLYGLVSFSGKVIVQPEYTNIYAMPGIEKSIIIEKNGFKGLVNSTLESIQLDCIYEEIKTLSKNVADDGYIVTKDGKKGICSATGSMILDCIYNDIAEVYGNSMYVINDGTWKIIDNSLNVVKDGGFDEVKSIDGENIILKQGENYGVISKSGVELIPYNYQDLKFAFGNYYIAKMNDRYGLIDLTNVVGIDFRYIDLVYLNKASFLEGENENYTTDVISKDLKVELSGVIISELNIDKAYMRIRVDGKYKYYNFNFKEVTNRDVLKTNSLFLVNKNGKYGYENKDGELIVDCIYDDAKEQNAYGFAAVKKNGSWGVVGQDGTVILKPTINLDDSLYIDFIGTWYLYKDTDINIYIK